MNSSEDVCRELAAELLNSAGEVRSVARGGSMLPTIFPGDMLEIRKQDFQDAKLGDVVLTVNRGHLCTHRVVREEFRAGRRVLITRGDSLPSEDLDPVGKEDFMGSVEIVVRRSRRFRPETSHGSLTSALRMMLRHSPGLRSGILRFHSLLSRVSQRAKNVRFAPSLSGDIA